MRGGEAVNAYEIAKEIGVAHTTVYGWAKRGLPYTEELKGTQRVMRFDLKEVKKWVEENRR